MPFSSCWSDVLRSHYNTDLVLFHDYRTGTMLDQGLNVLNGTAVQPVEQERSTRGKMIDPSNGIPVGGTAGYVNVADNAVLRLATTGTLIAFGRLYPTTGSRMLISKASVALWNYIIYYSTATLGFIENTGVSKTCAYATTQSTRMIGCTFLTANPVSFYANGNLAGVSVANCTITTGAGPSLQIGNSLWGGAVGINGTHPVTVALIFSSILTGAEISQLYNDYIASGFVL